MDLALGDQRVDRFLLEHLRVFVNVREDVGLEDKEAAIDPAAFFAGLFAEGVDFSAVQTKGPETCSRLDAGHSDILAMRFVEGDGGRNVDIGYAIAVSHAKRLVAFNVFCDLLESAAGAGFFASVNERDAPGLGDRIVNRHFVGRHIEGDVGGMQEVVGEVLLNDVTLVATADDEVIDAVAGVDLEDVPKNGQATDFDHGFGPDGGFFTDPGAETACEYHCLHPEVP